MLLAMALESLPRPQSWPLDNKLGGFVGDLLLWQSGSLSGLPLWLLALVAFPLGLAALFFAPGFTPERSEERRVVKECVRPCSSRCSRYHQNRNIYINAIYKIITLY